MSNTWETAVARYVAAMATLREPLTEDSIRAVQDALIDLSTAHYAVLVRSQERAAKTRAAIARERGGA